MANEYEISRVSGKCFATGRDFSQGEYYHAALFESAEGLERRDYSREAWSGPPEGCVCHWKGRVPTKEKKPTTIMVDSSILMNLFCRLEDDSSEMRQKFRFVLALLLMRKRLLRFEQAIRNDGREYWQVRLVQEQSIQQVLNPHLSEQEIDGLSAQLTAILSGDVTAIAELEEDEVAPPTGVVEATTEPDTETTVEADAIADTGDTEGTADPERIADTESRVEAVAEETPVAIPEETEETEEAPPDSDEAKEDQ